MLLQTASLIVIAAVGLTAHAQVAPRGDGPDWSGSVIVDAPPEPPSPGPQRPDFEFSTPEAFAADPALQNYLNSLDGRRCLERLKQGRGNCQTPNHSRMPVYKPDTPRPLCGIDPETLLPRGCLYPLDKDAPQL